MDYVALAAELAAGHPTSGAYAADPQAAADQINEKNQTRIKASMTGAEVWANTDPSEYVALSSDAKRSQWLAFCGITSHDPSEGGLAQQFTVSMFGSQSNTVAALSVARMETVSRAETLGFGRVFAGDIQYARGGV